MRRTGFFLSLLLLLGTVSAYPQTYPYTPFNPSAPQPNSTLPATPGGAALQCFNNATVYGLLSQDDAFRLCSGSLGTGPYDCYRESVRALIDSETAMKLCRCAVTSTRVDCYRQAKTTTELNDAQIIDLCTHDYESLNPRCNPSKPG